MDLVTEKFKQKIAAVFYLKGSKFNQTRILSTHSKANSEKTHCILKLWENCASMQIFVCDFIML